MTLSQGSVLTDHPSDLGPRCAGQKRRPGHATPCRLGINGVKQTGDARHIHPAWRSTVQDQRHIGKLRPFAPVRKVSFREPVRSGQLA